MLGPPGSVEDSPIGDVGCARALLQFVEVVVGLRIGCPHPKTFASHLEVSQGSAPKSPGQPFIFCSAWKMSLSNAPATSPRAIIPITLRKGVPSAQHSPRVDVSLANILLHLSRVPLALVHSRCLCEAVPKVPEVLKALSWHFWHPVG